MMVRAAVLKMKDPRQIIRDMEKLDEMGERAKFVFCCCPGICAFQIGLFLTEKKCLLSLIIFL